MKLWNCPKRMGFAPLLAGGLLEVSAVGHLIRMWRERSALGQNVWSWVMVLVAIALYGNFFRVCTPDARWARLMNKISLFTNTVVLCTVSYFRYLV